MLKRLSLAAAMVTAAAAPAFAHLDPQEHGSFAAGFSHPLFGMDHILVMVSVGLWAAQLARASQISDTASASKALPKALWLVPSAFVATMAAGFLMAVAGIELPFVEPAIMASVIALGLIVAIAVRMPVAACAAVVGIFALFHGHAHGGELGEAGALQFGIGFLIATALLHVAGIGLGLAVSHLSPKVARILGGFTALAGLSMVFG